MTPTLNEKFIAYLALLSGLTISVVAEYYSILGLTAIFAAASLAVIVMGIALGVGKITATLWLKQNWSIAPWSVRLYLLIAIVVLMAVTSMGIFGFLSKAHSDQSLVSGDAQAKISIYDEKIKISKENIDANRKALKQLDEAVDQVMARSQDEKGADKAVAIRRGQAKERTRLLQDIESEQKTIARLNEERAPIAAEVRKVEAEVGPIKYIAAFVYGDTDQTVLEKAVTWVIIILIVVFDPLAVILLLASQISFQNFRERLREEQTSAFIFENTEPPTKEELDDDFKFLAEYDDLYPDRKAEGDSPEKEPDVVSTATVTESIPHHPDTHPYLRQGFKVPDGYERVGPMVAKPEVPQFRDGGEHPKDSFEYEKEDKSLVEETKNDTPNGLDKLEEKAQEAESLFVQNEEQKESDLWSKVISQEEYQEQALSRQELTLQEWLTKIKAGEIKMTDVPEHLILDIRARM